MATRHGDGDGDDGGGERAGEATDAATPTAPPVPASWSEHGRRRARDARVLLVPVDGGATAETAMVLRWVAENVHRPGDRVHVLHVVPPSSWRRQDAAAEVRRRGEANERWGGWGSSGRRDNDRERAFPSDPTNDDEAFANRRSGGHPTPENAPPERPLPRHS